MEKKIKVLHVVGKIGKGGDTTAIENVLDYINKNNLNYSFDFLTHKGAIEERIKRLENKGSKVFILGGTINEMGIISYYREIEKLLKENKYDVVHFHTSFQSCVGMFAVKRCGVKRVVCHSHTSSVQRKINPLVRLFGVPICRFLVNRLATVKVACSEEAKTNLFGKRSKCEIVYNGLDIELLRNIDQKKVDEIKNQYDLDGKIVVGQVGRLYDMKNPLFTLELAKDFKNSNYVFMLLGDGTQREELEKKIVDEKIDNVILTGMVSDVNNYMALFDYLLLPSKYGEGLPVVLIEQQVVNDKCICISADNVTREANLGNVEYCSINLKKKWIDLLSSNKKGSKIDNEVSLMFDINNTSKKWLNLYE